MNVNDEISTPSCNELMFQVIDSSENRWTTIIPYSRVGFFAVGGNANGDNLAYRSATSAVKFYRSNTGTSAYTPKMLVFYR